jgi:hypothetical protein
MNRRDFLGNLVAVGTALAVPAAIMRAAPPVFTGRLGFIDGLTVHKLTPIKVPPSGTYVVVLSHKAYERVKREGTLRAYGCEFVRAPHEHHQTDFGAAAMMG